MPLGVWFGLQMRAVHVCVWAAGGEGHSGFTGLPAGPADDLHHAMTSLALIVQVGAPETDALAPKSGRSAAARISRFRLAMRPTWHGSDPR